MSERYARPHVIGEKAGLTVRSRIADYRVDGYDAIKSAVVDDDTVIGWRTYSVFLGSGADESAVKNRDRGRMV